MHSSSVTARQGPLTPRSERLARCARSTVVQKSDFKPAGKSRTGSRRETNVDAGATSRAGCHRAWAVTQSGGGRGSTRSAQRVEHLAEGVRLVDGPTDGEPAAAAHANAKVVLEGSLEKCPPIQPGAGGVKLALENSVPMSERQDVRSTPIPPSRSIELDWSSAGAADGTWVTVLAVAAATALPAREVCAKFATLRRRCRRSRPRSRRRRMEGSRRRRSQTPANSARTAP